LNSRLLDRLAVFQLAFDRWERIVADSHEMAEDVGVKFLIVAGGDQLTFEFTVE
jgi:hypothetical protein